MVRATVGDQPVALVVEDEFFIALEAIGLLRDLGYDVIECQSATEALAILRDRQDVRLVFTDIEMPGAMNGLALAAYIDATWPNIQILITSGRAAPGDDELPGKARFVAKPYEKRHIKRALESMCSSQDDGIS